MKFVQKILHFSKVDLTFLVLILGLAGSHLTHAYTEENSEVEMDQEEVIYADQLDVDGTYRKNKSQDSTLAEKRLELEQKNDEMVKNKIEKMRMEEELKMAEKLRGIFNGETKADPSAVAPAPESSVNAEANRPKLSIPFTPNFQISPYVGPGLVFSSFDNYEYKVITGINFDTYLHERITVGLGFQYSSLEISEYSVDWYYNWYLNNFGMNYSTRKIESDDLSLELNSKIYLMVGSRVRPYIGFGLGLNRSSMNYADADQLGSSFYDQRNIPFGDEGYTATYLSGSVRGGMDISFTDQVGMSLEGKYTKGLAEEITSKKGNPFLENQSQRLLEYIGKDINNSSKLSLNLGLYFMF